MKRQNKGKPKKVRLIEDQLTELVFRHALNATNLTREQRAALLENNLSERKARERAAREKAKRAEMKRAAR